MGKRWQVNSKNCELLPGKLEKEKRFIVNLLQNNKYFSITINDSEPSIHIIDVRRQQFNKLNYCRYSTVLIIISSYFRNIYKGKSKYCQSFFLSYKSKDFKKDSKGF